MPPLAEIGFIFDLDGVVIDSHVQHEVSWNMLFKELGRPMPEGFFKKTFGMRNQQIIPEWFGVKPDDQAEITRLADQKENAYREILRRDGIEPLPGVLALLRELKSLGIPRIVGSSTPRKNLEAVWDIAGLTGLFDDSVTAEDVKQGKPAPEVFLKAASKISRKPEHCVVIEDAHVGIEAGKSGGMKVLAVATTHPAETLHGADAVFLNLAGATVAKILAAVKM